MKKSNYAEITLDGAVIMVAVGFLLYTYMSTGDARPSDYELTAKLVHADGLAVGARLAQLSVRSVRHRSQPRGCRSECPLCAILLKNSAVVMKERC